jgi:hypothetical protein
VRRRRRTEPAAPTPLPPLPVARVCDATGSHIEPALDQGWSEPEKLAWKAGVVTADTGLRFRVFAMGTRGYSINVLTPGRSKSLPAMRFDDAWFALSMVSLGATAMRESLGETAHP